MNPRGVQWSKIGFPREVLHAACRCLPAAAAALSPGPGAVVHVRVLSSGAGLACAWHCCCAWPELQPTPCHEM